MQEMSELEKALYVPSVKEKIEPLLKRIGLSWGQYCSNSERIIQKLIKAKFVARPKLPVTKDGRHALSLKGRNKSILGVIDQYAGKRIVIVPWNHSIFPQTSYRRLYKRGRLVELPVVQTEEEAVLGEITPLSLLQKAYADKDITVNHVGYVWYEIGDKETKHPRVARFIENIEGRIVADTAKGLVRIEDLDQYSKHAHAAKYGHIMNLVIPSISKKEVDEYKIQLSSFPVRHKLYEDASYATWFHLSTDHVCPKKRWMMKWLRAKTDIDALVGHGGFSKENYFDFHDVAGAKRAIEVLNKKKEYKVHIDPFFENAALKNFRDKLVNHVIIEVKAPPKGQVRRYNLNKPLQELFMQKYVIENQDIVLR